MSRTLFWYVFKDLFRIFFLASAALAGIMSFGGLLRPIYEHGLNAAQVVQMLGYFMPAMTTYSLPIAALYATTVVYGRLGADNEVTAARAAGISHLSLALPGLVMGLIIALVSLLFLCFVVPVFWLKIEQVLYSNLAELVTNQIQRTHQIRFDHGSTPLTVYAREAIVGPTDPHRPREQVVQILGPLFVTYDTSDRSRPPVPEEFYFARTATAYIRQTGDESSVMLVASLRDGMRFPRRPTESRRKNMQVSVGSTTFGPIALPSPVRENTKFMDIFRLRALLEQPELSRRVRSTLGEFIVADQQELFIDSVEAGLSGDTGLQQFEAADGTYVLQRGDATAQVRKGRLILSVPDGGRPISFVQRRGREVVLDVAANELRMRCFPDADENRLDIEVEMIDCVVAAGEERTPRPSFGRRFRIESPPAVTQLRGRTPRDYLRGSPTGSQQKLLRDVLKIYNSVVSELNARASFGVSCLILVMVGCALGMMFRSGNFLSAFALSVIPALMCIALIVTGQHTCENVPWNLTPGQWSNPLPFGLMLIWGGNAAIAAIAVVLLWRLQRQ